MEKGDSEEIGFLNSLGKVSLKKKSVNFHTFGLDPPATLRSVKLKKNFFSRDSDLTTSFVRP